MGRIMDWLFGKRIHPVTPDTVPPAPVPDQEKESRAQGGRNVLAHSITRAELTTAGMQRSFAASAAERLRR